MIESRLLELIEYRMGKTHNNVALAREILAEVSRPESGSVGSVPSVEELAEAFHREVDDSEFSSKDWLRISDGIKAIHALLSTAHRGEVKPFAWTWAGHGDRYFREGPEKPVSASAWSLEIQKTLHPLYLHPAPAQPRGVPDKRDVILPWVELQDLLMYFHTIGDEKAETMLRGLSPAPGVAEAVEAQREYIKLLEAELGDVIGIAAAHGWKSSHYEQGIDLRAKIDRALSSLGVKP